NISNNSSLLQPPPKRQADFRSALMVMKRAVDDCPAFSAPAVADLRSHVAVYHLRLLRPRRCHVSGAVWCRVVLWFSCFCICREGRGVRRGAGRRKGSSYSTPLLSHPRPPSPCFEFSTCPTTFSCIHSLFCQYINRVSEHREEGKEEEIVRTNVLDVMLCCRQAMRLMRDQPGGGHIFDMDGAGADGNATPR
ncbi:unnamed protein product, partial [Closterium sp. Naga37s-1]